MARDRSADRSRWLDDPPSDVRVTVTSGTSPGSRSRLRLVVLGLVVVAAAGTAAVEGLHGAGVRHAPRVVLAAADGGRPAADSVYRYPLGCLGAALSRRGPARADPDPSSPCWHYGIYITAILRRVDGTWRLALEAAAPSCPVRSLPAAVELEIRACRRLGSSQRVADDRGGHHPGPPDEAVERAEVPDS